MRRHLLLLIVSVSLTGCAGGLSDLFTRSDSYVGPDASPYLQPLPPPGIELTSHDEERLARDGMPAPEDAPPTIVTAVYEESEMQTLGEPALAEARRQRQSAIQQVDYSEEKPRDREQESLFDRMAAERRARDVEPQALTEERESSTSRHESIFDRMATEQRSQDHAQHATTDARESSASRHESIFDRMATEKRSPDHAQHGTTDTRDSSTSRHESIFDTIATEQRSPDHAQHATTDARDSSASRHESIFDRMAAERQTRPLEQRTSPDQTDLSDSPHRSDRLQDGPAPREAQAPLDERDSGDVDSTSLFDRLKAERLQRRREEQTLSNEPDPTVPVSKIDKSPVTGVTLSRPSVFERAAADYARRQERLDRRLGRQRSPQLLESTERPVPVIQTVHTESETRYSATSEESAGETERRPRRRMLPAARPPVSELGDAVDLQQVPPPPEPLPERAPETRQPAALESMPSRNLYEEDVTDGRHLPIDLPTVLRLAGADNWAIRLAREQICQAQAESSAADALWLPTIRFGLGYNKHEGRIQATPGQVIKVSRNSLYIGAGGGVAGAPLNGGSGGPARLFVDLSIADAIFEPLAAQQLVSAARARQHSTFNDTLMQATVAYYDLVEAQARASIAMHNLADTRAMKEVTRAFVQAGKAADAETARVEVFENMREQDLVEAHLAMRTASADLARILQLDPRKLSPEVLLQTVEPRPVPVELVHTAGSLQGVISQAQSRRPETAEAAAQVSAACARVAQEEWRPWLPHLHLGLSGGAFGGGPGSDFDGLDGRMDFDALAVWEVRNLGYGTRALQDRRVSEHRQQVLRRRQLLDAIANEVARAWYQVEATREAQELAEENIERATEVYDRNRERIRGLVGLPLEALQALQALGQARFAYLTAVMDYNRAQCRLLRAVGHEVQAPADGIE